MKTDDLIDDLGRGLRPVRRLSPPGWRAAAWLVCGVVYVTAMGTWAWSRRGALGVEPNLPYLLQQGALAVAGALAAFGAFASVVPGTKSGAWTWLAVPAVAMITALSWGAVGDWQWSGTAGFGRETDWPCVISITVGTLGLWGIAGSMLRRGALLEPRVTTVLAGIAALSLANIEACISRVHAFTATVILWHGVTATVVLLGLLAFGPMLLTSRQVTVSSASPRDARRP